MTKKINGYTYESFQHHVRLMVVHYGFARTVEEADRFVTNLGRHSVMAAWEDGIKPRDVVKVYKPAV